MLPLVAANVAGQTAMNPNVCKGCSGVAAQTTPGGGYAQPHLLLLCRILPRNPCPRAAFPRRPATQPAENAGNCTQETPLALRHHRTPSDRNGHHRTPQTEHPTRNSPGSCGRLSNPEPGCCPTRAPGRVCPQTPPPRLQFNSCCPDHRRPGQFFHVRSYSTRPIFPPLPWPPFDRLPHCDQSRDSPT